MIWFDIELIPRRLGNWTNNETCVATDDEKRGCGPGTIIQIRSCTDGSDDKCDETEWLDDHGWELQEGYLKRMISCEEAGSPLSDCKRILSEWFNVTQCMATGNNETCGPGNITQKRNCTDGTLDKCADLSRAETQRNISCSLPECEGRLFK